MFKKLFEKKIDRNLIEQNILLKDRISVRNLIFEEEFYVKHIVGKEKEICEMFNCRCISVYYEGSYTFIHNSNNGQSVLNCKKICASKPDTIPLGGGIYCYCFNAYQKIYVHMPDKRFKINYNGKYIKCVFDNESDADGHIRGEAAVEYVLLVDELNDFIHM